MTRAAGVRQIEITRAIRAAQALGLHVAGVELAPGGLVRVLTGDAPARPMSALEQWRAKKGGGRAA